MAILKENRITKRNDNLPEYILIKQYLLNAISKHLVLPHQKLPSERELAELFSVNRNTSRHALNVLEKEGYIYRS
jgi:DNA-binding GntR family transcriptional regulator